MKKTEHKIVKRNVKHVFTPEETAKLNVDFGQSFDALQSAEADKKSVVGTYTAKVQEAEARWCQSARPSTPDLKCAKSRSFKS